MKKLIALLALVVLTTVAFSQSKPVKQDPKKTTVKTEAAVTSGKQTAKPAVKTAGPIKSDGTADMRYKANKAAAKSAAPAPGPSKKDGTPDMRYKQNKSTTSKGKK
jgi:hypothetical protein